MPKYVFEVSITLAEHDGLDALECQSITAALCERLAMHAALFGKRGGRISAESPFEQVTGDWLPPDPNGVTKMGASRSIDL